MEIKYRLSKTGIIQFRTNGWRWMSTSSKDWDEAEEIARTYAVEQMAEAAKKPESIADDLIKRGKIDEYCSLAVDVLAVGRAAGLFTQQQIEFLHCYEWLKFVYSGKVTATLREKYRALFASEDAYPSWAKPQH